MLDIPVKLDMDTDEIATSHIKLPVNTLLFSIPFPIYIQGKHNPSHFDKEIRTTEFAYTAKEFLQNMTVGQQQS